MKVEEAPMNLPMGRRSGLLFIQIALRCGISSGDGVNSNHQRSRLEGSYLHLSLYNPNYCLAVLETREKGGTITN